MSGLNLDDFLHHSSSSSGGGFLKNWKEEGQIYVWLHPKARIYPLWSHRWQRLDTGDRENPLSEYKPQRFNCLEEEAVLKRQRFRNDDGSREAPPVICPHCLMIEWVRSQILAKKLDWKTPIFRFGESDDEKALVIRAGGFCGLFQSRNLSDEQKRELRRAGIRVDKAYMENGMASLQYIFSVISNSSPKDGCIIAMEKPALGDKMKKAIRDRIESLGQEKGHPCLNPVAFKWEYDDNEVFSAKYNCNPLERIELTDEVRRIMDEPPPDVSYLTEPSDLAAHRLSLEHHALIDMPFDEFFAPAEEKFGPIQGAVEDDIGDDQQEDDFPESWGGSAKPSGEAKGAAKAEAPTEDLVACDKCGKGMPEDAMVCPHCGAEYEEVTEDNGEVVIKLKPEKPLMRRRGSRKG